MMDREQFTSAAVSYTHLSWIKKIVFNFPVPVDGEEVKELPLETETTVETVCLLSKKP